MKFAAAEFINAVRRACLVHQESKDLAKYPGIEFVPDEYGHCIVRTTDGDVSFAANITNLDIPKEAGVIDPSFVLPSGRLYQIFNNPDKAWETITMNENKNDVSFRMGRVKAKLTKVKAAPPPIPTIEETATFEASAFGRLIDQVAWARDTKSKGALSGVYLSPTCVAATDKFYAGVMLTETNVDGEYIIPVGPVRKVFAGLTEFGEDLVCRVGASDGRLFISVADVQYAFSLVDGADKYVPVEEMFRKEGRFASITHREVAINPTKFRAAIQRLRAMSGDERGQKVNITFEGSTMKLTSVCSEGGDYVEVVDIPEEVEPLDFPITLLADKLADVLNRLGRTKPKMLVPDTVTGSDVRFNSGDHWMLLGRMRVT